MKGPTEALCQETLTSLSILLMASMKARAMMGGMVPVNVTISSSSLSVVPDSSRTLPIFWVDLP